jgi:WD40 repeat protein
VLHSRHLFAYKILHGESLEMVLVESPLWVLHSNTTAPPALDYTSISHLEATAKEKENTDAEKCADSNNATVEKGRRKKAQATSIRNFFANRSAVGRNAIYSVDVCYNNSATAGGQANGIGMETVRFATGGGDGRVRVWNCRGLFANRVNQGAQVKNSSTENKDDNGGHEIGGKRKNYVGGLSHFNVKGGYESGVSIGDMSSSDSEEASSKSPLAAAATNKDDALNEQEPRLLATLHTHEGSVLCTRWSHNGKYLASAGDDAHVLLYTQRSSAMAALVPSSFGDNNATPNIEHWARIRTCRGHGLDVVGLAWAPDDSHLASCSLDRESPIIIWRVCEVLPGVGGYDVSMARKRGGVGGGLVGGLSGSGLSGSGTSQGQVRLLLPASHFFNRPLH